MTLQICHQCQQTYLLSDAKCPHCIVTKPSAAIIPLAILLGIGLTGCLGQGGEAMYGVPIYDMDRDEDGFYESLDCNDEDANTHPGAAPQDSEDDCMTDEDGDGYGSDSPEETSMGISVGSDCDDSNPNIFPGAEEIAEDGVDQNCNGNDDD